jgi:hypothetical protein
MFIEMPVPSQEIEGSCICLLRVSIFSFSTIFLLDFGNVPTVFLFYSFISLLNVILKGQIVQVVIPNNNNNNNNNRG